MSVITTADIAEFRALAEQLGFPDAYALNRTTTTADGEGGETSTTGTVEAGACSLTAEMTRPEERVIADRQGYQAPYVLELPYATTATPGDTIAVNGARTFEIGGVLRDGAWGITARLICEERQ